MKKKQIITNKKSTRNTSKLPLWNLGDLYKSITSKRISIDLEEIQKSAKKFENKYEGNICKLSAGRLFNSIVELERIDELMDKILSFAHLLVAENSDIEKNKIFFQQMQEKITSYSSFLIFLP